MVSFEKILELNGIPISHAEKEIEKVLSYGELDNFQNKRKWEILNVHYNNNPIYKDFIKEIPKNWNDVPIITKNDLNKIQHKNLKFPKVIIRQTSGSTGKTLTYAIDQFCHALTWSIIQTRYNSIGISLNDKQARFYGKHKSIIPRTTDKIKDYFGNRYRITVTDISDATIDKWMRIFRRKSFKYIYGYSYPIISLAKYLYKNNLKLNDTCPSLIACIVTSEMCSVEEEALIQSTFGVSVYNEYGASELGIIGFGKSQDWQITNEQLLVEIVDDNGKIVPDGQTGRIICTNLFNLATPFIRYEVGDIGCITTKNGIKRLTQLYGRQEETLYLKSGRKAPGDTIFFYIIKDFNFKFKNIVSEYRVIQHNLEEIEFQIVCDSHPKKKHLDYLTNETKNALGKDITVKYSIVPEIERTRLGKFRRFISRI